ncbi:MAG: glycosyltransferase, partial [Solirubrobacteraceae bacterium]
MTATAGALAAWQWVMLAFFLFVNTFALAFLGVAASTMRRRSHILWEESRERLLGSRVTPRISVVAPAYNEANTVAQSVRALLTLRYPNLELVLVNDGSSDDTLAVVEGEFDLAPIHPIFRREV